MGLFDQILGAVNNPNQQASPDQLSAIVGMVQQLSNRQGLDANSTQAALSVVGSYVRSALQQQRATGGSERVEAIVNQYGGSSPSGDVLETLFSPAQQHQVAQAVAQRTGISADKVLALLPILVPIVLSLLKQGNAVQPSTGAKPASAGTVNAGSGSANPHSANPGSANPVLTGFLDSDGDGDVDIGDAMAMAGRFLQR